MPARHLLRRLAAGAAALSTAALMLAGCAGGSPAATTAGAPITVGLTYTPNIQFAPFYVAEKLGYFEEAGVSVELRHHGESEELFGALESGTEQLVYAGGDETVQSIAGGVPVQSVATVYRRYPAVIIVPAGSLFTSIEDLRGHTIGTPGPYGETYFALLAALHSAGMTEADVSVQHIGFTQQAALTSGKVDAVMGFSNNDAVQFERAGFPVRAIDAVDPASPTLVGPVIASSTDFIQNRGEDITKVLTALERAIQYIATDIPGAVDIATEYVPTLSTPEAKADATATLEATLPLMLTDTGAVNLQNTPETWAAMTSFMQEAGLITQPVAPEQAFTNAFVPKA